MISFFNFGKKKQDLPDPILVDMHSHLLPGLDDGVEDLGMSLEIIKEFKSLGYRKLITTPHIMGDFYKNTPAGINEKLAELKAFVKEKKIDIKLEAAAEYYLDEWFMEKVENAPLLTFGNKYLLFETSYINEPSHLDEAIFLMKSNGYRPVLAHPERYTYLYGDFKRYSQIRQKGVLFQINLNSLSGYYSKSAQDIAIKLIDNNLVDMVGSDCHGSRHMEALKKSRMTKAYKKLLSSPIINNQL